MRAIEPHKYNQTREKWVLGLSSIAQGSSNG